METEQFLDASCPTLCDPRSSSTHVVLHQHELQMCGAIRVHIAIILILQRARTFPLFGDSIGDQPLGTVTAPPVSITGVCTFGEMASVEVEHFAASFRISELAPSVEANQNSRKLALWKGNFSEMKTGSAVHRRYTAESLSLTY